MMGNEENYKRRTINTLLRDEIIRAERSYRERSGHDPFFFAWASALRWAMKRLKENRKIGKIIIPKENLDIHSKIHPIK